jgi:arylsulfatase A-like enzyme
MLRVRGYDNSAVGKWHLANPRSEEGLRHPLDSGFAWYAGSPANLRDPKTPGDEGYFHWKKNTNGVVSWSRSYATSETIDDSIARIRAMQEPWLLWVAFNAAHFPLHVPPAHLHTPGNTDNAPDVFRAIVEALDSEIGRLLDAIDPALLARTMVIFVSDNGSPMIAVADAGSENRFKRTLYEKGINVPLIVSGPEVRRPGTESAALVHVVDVLATVAEIAEVDTGALTRDDGQPLVLDGQSFLAQIRDPLAPSSRRTVFQDRFAPNGRGPFDEDSRALRDERYKLLQLANGREQLFDLDGRHDDGPDLMGDLTPERSAAYERLRHEIERTVAELDADRRATLPERSRPGRGAAKSAAGAGRGAGS